MHLVCVAVVGHRQNKNLAPIHNKICEVRHQYGTMRKWKTAHFQHRNAPKSLGGPAPPGPAGELRALPQTHTHTHTHPFNGSFPGLPG